MNAIIIAIAALLATHAVQETARVDNDLPAYWTGDQGWRVFSYPEERMCDLGLPTESGEYVTVGWNPATRNASLLVTNRHATSIKAGETRRLAVVFAKSPGEKPDSIHEADFKVLEADGKLALATIGTHAGFLDDFARSGVMAVIVPDGGVVSAIMLTGSREAVTQLRACAAKASVVASADPFARR